MLDVSLPGRLKRSDQRGPFARRDERAGQELPLHILTGPARRDIQARGQFVDRSIDAAGALDPLHDVVTIGDRVLHGF
jgi:hypothetical protein